MVLVDTSVWVSHLRAGNTRLEQFLNRGEVACHALIIGELACGHLKNRSEILSSLHALPMTIEAEHDEVLQFIEHRRLMGKGLGYIDVHLLASAVLTGVSFWTLDNKLSATAVALSLSA